ncbi:hypothetical protein DQT32_04610 [Salmonella enterica subsp. enterica serovar Braenderup]|nr:hypothetical protein [Salmonella enterica subsp. enterica serovar Braenderup]
MIDLNGENYVTVLVEAGRIMEGTEVRKPMGDVPYTIHFEEPPRNLRRTNYNRYGRDTQMVYLLHECGIYYDYPMDQLLKLTVYKYDLQNLIDETCEY